MRSLDENTLLELFGTIDSELTAPLTVTVLGGAAIVLHRIVDRSTIDIDIAPTADATRFAKLGAAHGIPIDIITMTSTVDLVHCDTTRVYTGKQLCVRSITALDLLKSKLERYRKHDANDIAAIITHIDLPYTEFAKLATDMLIDYIGNPIPLKLSTRDIVERHYPEHLGHFDTKIIAH